MNYREYKEGDTVRIIGCQGRLFSTFGKKRLNGEIALGVECVLIGGENERNDVKLPRGILANDQTDLSLACIELVHAVEDKPSSAIERFNISPDYQSFRIIDPASQSAIAQIWHGKNRMPEEVAKAFIEDIKSAYDNIVTQRKNINSDLDSDKTTNKTQK